VTPEDVAPIIALLVVTAGLVMIFRGPVGKAIARRLEGPPALSGDAEARLGELEGRVAELERERDELAERVDFAERLLGQVKDAARELPR
jgi:hypothetical protein